MDLKDKHRSSSQFESKNSVNYDALLPQNSLLRLVEKQALWC